MKKVKRLRIAFVLMSVFVLLMFPGTFVAAQTETVLYSFAGGSDGAQPQCGLTFDSSGNLYGTTGVGGSNGLGTVFRLSPILGGGWSESVLYSFKGGSDGANPFYGTLVRDSHGNLYGTTQDGGSKNEGTAYELSQVISGVWRERILHDFLGGSDGAYPESGLTFHKGVLYGETYEGGSDGSGGTVFDLVPGVSGWTENVLTSINNSLGAGPSGGLIFDG